MFAVTDMPCSCSTVLMSSTLRSDRNVDTVGNGSTGIRHGRNLWDSSGTSPGTFSSSVPPFGTDVSCAVVFDNFRFQTCPRTVDLLTFG